MYLTDTWEWDGTAWVERAPSVSPPGRGGLGTSAQMAYDAARGQVVLFGGTFRTDDGDVELGDTWEWDGTAWVELTPTPSPVPRHGHALAYDATRGRVVLFGGAYTDGSWNTVMLADVWEWDGATWEERTAATSPSVRFEHAVAYDTERGRLVSFGGWGNTGGRLDDTWEWDGTTWMQRSPAAVPAIRTGHGQAYDAARGRVVLFGGEAWTASGSDYVNDTWEWDGGTWEERTPVASPPVRYSPVLVYDAQRRRTVLFGGYNLAAVYNLDDTWEWDGATWTQRFPLVSPLARSLHAAAYDARRGQVLVFGGLHTAWGVSETLDDTWVWNGTTWTERSTGPSPAARYGHQLAYDAARDRIVLFGGMYWNGNATVYLGDTWVWNGTTWTELHPSVAPAARASHGMAYDAALGKVVLHGGRHAASLNDTLDWDGTTWTERRPDNPPSPRTGFALSYDAARKGTVLFGGRWYSGLSNETWTYRFEAPVPDETCRGFDTDGDGLIGCDDPDCAGFCTPLCAPSMTACPPAWPRCGDGVCSGVESCRLCPADCGTCPAGCGDFFCDASETASTCPGDCALCGDGVRQISEACDDANRTGGDGCSASCALE